MVKFINNSNEFARRYPNFGFIVAAIGVCVFSFIGVTVEHKNEWSFLILYIGYTVIFYEIGYKKFLKIHHKKKLFVIFYFIPWIINSGFVLYRVIFRLGLI